MNKLRFTFDDVERALRQSRGMVSMAAKLLEAQKGKCDPHTVRNYLKRWPKLQHACDEIVQEHIDLAETKLLAAIQDSNMTAVIFYLKTKGRDRGYIERFEHTGKDGKDLPPPVIQLTLADTKV